MREPMNLYDYQNQCVDSIRNEIRAGHDSLLVQSPTGSG